MKLSKTNFILLCLNIIILPLFGNNDIENLLNIGFLVNILYYLLPTLLLISLIHNLIKNKYKIKININFVLYLIYILSLIISLVFAITYKGYTFTNLYKFIILITIFLLLNSVIIDNEESKINKIIIFLSIFIAIFGICQYIFNFQLTLNGTEKYIGSIGRIKSTFLIATIYDKFLSFIIIYLFYLLYNKKENILLIIICLFFNFLALGLTYSRTGLIISLLSLIIFSCYNIIKKRFKLLLIIPIIILTLSSIPGEIYVFKSILNVTIKKTTINEKYEANNNIDYSLVSREYYMSLAKKLMLKYPLTGIGIGNYNYLYENQNIKDYIDIEPGYYLYPHNMYYQLGAETGIICLISFYILIIYNLLKRKNIFSYLFLMAIIISSFTESIFYIKDLSYFMIILISIIPYKKEN